MKQAFQFITTCIITRLLKVNEKVFKKIMENVGFLKERIAFYEQKRILTRTDSAYEIKGHLEKARHNLSFLSEIREPYNDWALVTCYYASYHAALALIMTKGYSSKNHDATMCVLIRDFYKKELTKEELTFLNLLDAQDLLFYSQSKRKREEASYSTKRTFSKSEVSIIKMKSQQFVNKVEHIIKESLDV